MATLKPENENAGERYVKAPAWGPEEEAAVERVLDEIGREWAAGKKPPVKPEERLRYISTEPPADFAN